MKIRRFKKLSNLMLLISCICLIVNTVNADTFNWPNGNQVAVSLTFDDSRNSQADVGIPILNEYGIRATFYVIPELLKERLPVWKAAVSLGHEIGNHSMMHPCQCASVTSGRSLENYTIERLGNELDASNLAIERMLGVKPVSFAYPCGNTHVGRGENARSYIPVISKKFKTGRDWLNEFDNAPTTCDLSDLMGKSIDNLDFYQIKAMIEKARQNGDWLILAGHEISHTGKQTVHVETLKKLCEYIATSENKVWAAPVCEVAAYITYNKVNLNADKKKLFVRPRKRLLALWFIAGLTSFVIGFLSVSRIPPFIVKYVLATGTIALLLLSCWSIRYGYIGYKSFNVLLISIGFLLGTLCAFAWHMKPLKSQIHEKGE